MRVEFLRLNRNVMLAVFIGMTADQVTLALSTLGTDYDNLDRGSSHVFEATSLNSPGYTVVQMDRTGAVIPPAVKETLRIAVNNIATGVLTGE